MKSKNSKFWLFFTIICNALIVLCFIVGVILMFKFDSPKEIDSDDFIGYMEQKGCTLINIQQQEKYYGVKTYLATDIRTCPYLFIYTTFSDRNTLGQFFYEVRDDVLNGNSNVDFETSVNIFSNYYEYSTGGDYYKAVTLNKNSVLYASVLKEYKADTINIFEELNYKYDINLDGFKIIFGSIIILLLICFVSMWGVEKKIRNKGWISLIPFYNIGCLSKDILGSAWYSLLLLIPIGNLVFIFMFYYNMGKVFNKNETYCGLLMFFPSVLWPLLAFDDSAYTKPEKKSMIRYDIKNSNFKNNGISNEKQSFGKIVVNLIKWTLTSIFLFLGAIVLLVYFDEKLVGYLFLSIILLIYGFMICPAITDSTKKYEKYTKFKPLFVIILVIINIMMFAIFTF